MKRPVLDRNFYPMADALKDYAAEVLSRPEAERTRVTLVVERSGGYNFVYAYDSLRDGVDDERSYKIAERLVKTVLWICGGFRVGVAGSDMIASRLKEDYREGGKRAFDADFMSGVYERPFEVIRLETNTVPPEKRESLRIGGFTSGCRIGFDAGGSDRKVAAVVDGKVVYSEEVVWHPKTQPDPHYHYNEILTAMRTAASHMPRVDCIGVSSAGVYIQNRIMVASLFLAVDKKKYGDFVKDMYLNVAKEIGAPVEVANDGDVTALAGSMELGEGRVLGIAMGTSEAVGYINAEGGITGWLSELAFAPVDFSDSAMRDEWSGDIGVGCKYFSQDGVIKLAEYGGYVFPEGLTPAEKLKIVQALAEEGDELATNVFRDIGIYLAHTLPYYAKFYDIKHVLLLGRVMSGRGGDLVLSSCKEALGEEYPELAEMLSTPDGSSRRVGQAIAAASLPRGNTK